MIDTNRNANYFPHTYHIRSLMTANGVRQWFSPTVESYLRNQTAVETAVLAVLRTETALSRNDIIDASLEYLREQADPDFPTDCPTPPTDDDIALAIVQLVDMGVAELVVIKEASVPMSANPLEQASQGKTAPGFTFSFSSIDVPFSSESAVADTPLIWLQQLCSPWENHDDSDQSDPFMGNDFI